MVAGGRLSVQLRTARYLDEDDACGVARGGSGGPDDDIDIGQMMRQMTDNLVETDENHEEFYSPYVLSFSTQITPARKKVPMFTIQLPNSSSRPRSTYHGVCASVGQVPTSAACAHAIHYFLANPRKISARYCFENTIAILHIVGPPTLLLTRKPSLYAYLCPLRLWGLSTTAVVKIQLIDVNDNAPAFTARDYNVSLREGRISSTEPVVAVSALDADSGRYGTVTYRIVSGNERELFSINKDSGEIFVVKPTSLAENSKYDLEVSATDGGGSSAPTRAAVHVSVTPARTGAALFDKPRYNLRVVEDARAGAVVGDLKASATDRAAVPGTLGGHTHVHAVFMLNAVVSKLAAQWLGLT
ncbi:Protein dachsous [Eumeta japonica]|uniref:Protein dachsous n=1 Tax=Eumeta variegata TaxID=151549 RepID=A0A4C1ZCE1_EUMVA|nr:Protein dachsous [Eumeta japonica]